MNIRKTFLDLTSKTYPHGTESELDSFLTKLDTDEFGNRFLKIGNSTCMFTSHLDTATSAKTEVIHVIEDNIIKTDGKSILGADDKAGVTIMLYMIENNIPGLYYFFLGEEVGCVGSRKVSGKVKTIVEDKESINYFKDINKVISFDRRGNTSVITHQSSSRCCSDEFGEALAKELNKHDGFEYKIDPTGIYTDSAQFTRIYPECTNISVGYKSEHTFSEQQDIVHLEELCKSIINVDWEALPVKRDPSKYEYSSRYSYYGGGWDGFDDYDWETPYRGNPVKPAATIETDEELYFMDDEYNHVSSIKQKRFSSKLIAVDFAPERIDYEETMISELLASMEVPFKEITWDGTTLIVKYDKTYGHSTQCSREELSDFLPTLNFWKREIDNDFDRVY